VARRGLAATLLLFQTRRKTCSLSSLPAVAMMMTIAPPPNSTQASIDGVIYEDPRPRRIARELEQAAEADRARRVRVHKILGVSQTDSVLFNVRPLVPMRSSEYPSDVSSSSAKAGPPLHQAAGYPLFAISISGALNNLLSIKSSPEYRSTPVAVFFIDGIGPPLSYALGPRVAAELDRSAHTANIFELYFIVDTAVRCAPLDIDGLVDAFMLISCAVNAGYTLLPDNIRQTFVAALSIAHERAGAKQKQPKEFAADFASRCFPSLNLQNLAATEYMLSQKLKFDLRCLDLSRDRQKCTAGLAKVARHYEEAFCNYLRIIFRNDTRE